MPQAAVGAVEGSAAGEQNHNDEPASPASSPTAAGPPPVSRPGGSSSRKRRSQEPSASELRYPRRRALKACRLCRARKTKCDNVQPTCGFCSSIGATCSYDDSQSNHSFFDPTSGEILRTLGQLVDSQKELLQVIRAGNNRANQPDATPTCGITSSFAVHHAVHHGQPTHPWAEEATSWTSPRYNEPVLEPARSGPDPISSQRSNNTHSPGTPFEQQQAPRSNFAESSPGAFTIAGSPAALRWFGLLANDAGREVIQTAEFEAGPSSGLPDDGVFAGATPLQRATKIVDGTPDAIGTTNYRVSFADDIGLPARLLERQLWQAKDVIQLLPSEKVVFESFVQHISLWIDLFDPRRHFSAVVPRLALHNAGLMNAILALSCHHLSATHDSASPETTHENDALQYYYQTLHYVQKAMQHASYQNSNELIATTLIISTYEMLTGSQKDWERHLQGVFWILRSQNINVEIEALESAVWWAWLRQDIWAAFREKRKTYTAWTPKKTYNIMNPYEMASRAVWHLAQVVNFCSPAANPTDRNELHERLDMVEQLLQMLNEWRQSLPVEFYPLPAATEDPSSAFRPLLIYPPCYGLAIQAHYVSRILLSFHEPSFGGVGVYADRMRSIESWIHIVCGVGMTLTDSASGILSSQCMFIAGMFTQDRRERECVLELLAGCRSRTGWPADPLEDELEEIWADGSAKERQ